jgi:hypothetical protein
MVEYNQVDSAGLLDPELTSKVGVSGRKAGDEIYRGMAPYGTPPGGQGAAVPVKPLSPEAPAPWRPKPRGYPTEPETRSTSGSSIGPEYTGDQPAIPERGTTEEIPKGFTKEDYRGPGMYMRLGKENVAGDEAARQRIGIESRTQFGEPTHARSTLNIGGKSLELAGGRTLAEKEQAGGGSPPGEFDFNTYKKALETVGGNVGLKTRMAILEHMMGSHEKKVDAYNKWKELSMTHGPESPYAKNIASEIQSRAIQAQHVLSTTPFEIAKSIEETAHIKAQTEAIPFDVAYKKSMTEYHNSLVNAKEFANESSYLKIIADKFEKALPGSQEAKDAQKQFDEIVEHKRGGMMVERFEQQNPKFKGKVKWENGRLVEIK